MANCISLAGVFALEGLAAESRQVVMARRYGGKLMNVAFIAPPGLGAGGPINWGVVASNAIFDERFHVPAAHVMHGVSNDAEIWLVESDGTYKKIYGEN